MLIASACLLIFAACTKDDDSPKEKRYLEKVVIEKAQLAGWDVLSGPDLILSYRDGLVDSTSLEGESEFLEDVVAVPIVFEEVAFELTNFIYFQVLDVDEFVADQVLFELQFNPYAATEKGNPFEIKTDDWTIKMFWKTQ